MIIFYEGLLGFGKSYEVLVKYIIFLLEKGCKVYVRFNGFNYEKVSELIGWIVDEFKEFYIEVIEE